MNDMISLRQIRKITDIDVLICLEIEFEHVE